jgi:hypothetical protein
MTETQAVFSEQKILRAAETAVRPRVLAKVLIPIVVIATLAGLIAAERYVVPSIPINVDPAYYAVVSHELLNGESLYSDIWDHKPPAPFIIYGAAELLFGYGTHTLVILHFILTFGLLILFFLVGRCGPGGNLTGYLAAALWALVSGSIGLEGRDPNTEIMMNACLMGAFLLFVSSSSSSLSRARSMAVGSLFLFATMFKPVVVAAAVLICIAHVALSSERRAAFRDVAVIGSVGILGWAATFGYFAATGRGRIFYDSMISFNHNYSGSIIQNLIAPLLANAELLIDVVAPLAVFGSVGFLFILWFDRRMAAFVLAFVAAGWFSIAAPGRFSVHYYQLWLPPLIVAASWGIGVLFTQKKKPLTAAGALASFILLASLVDVQVPSYREIYNGKHVPVVEKLAYSDRATRVINSKLEAGETFFLWGITTNLYLLTDRRPPALIIFDSHLEPGPLYAALSERVRSDLERNRPEMLVVEQGRPAPPEWITSGYLSEPLFIDRDSYAIYARRDGRLAGELVNGSPYGGSSYGKNN